MFCLFAQMLWDKKRWGAWGIVWRTEDTKSPDCPTGDREHLIAPRTPPLCTARQMTHCQQNWNSVQLWNQRKSRHESHSECLAWFCTKTITIENAACPFYFTSNWIIYKPVGHMPAWSSNPNGNHQWRSLLDNQMESDDLPLFSNTKALKTLSIFVQPWIRKYASRPLCSAANIWILIHLFWATEQERFPLQKTLQQMLI